MSKNWGEGRLKVDSLECGQNFAAMVCSTAEMLSVGGNVCHLLPSLPGSRTGKRER